MIKKLSIFIFLSLIFISSPAIGSDRTFRDRYGNITETWERNSSGQTTVRDRYGDYIGSRERNGNSVTIRDRYGNEIGREDITND